ncbi:uncharacterized protein L203_102373 [Cryptococcus depauperatus CBS 7841]|uniref:Uncharacterized protein n=1 Tax=Cryptococcus depauperatus CBS 7841 TaxID=1295531 RepID=A0A1E3IAD9_9TREE|nr:minor histocompatibility antigen H13 [Cryptococcus depauperatus CBS 7841]
MSSDAVLWATYASLCLQALLPITIGSFKSLKTPQDTKKRLKEAKKAKLDDADEEEDEEPIEETLTWQDSLLFPVLGSVVLLGMFLILKYFGKKWITLILGAYFGIAGVFAVQLAFSSILSFVLRMLSIRLTVYHVRISSGIRQIYHLPFTLPTLFVVPIAIAVPILYITLGRAWILSNILALSFSTETLALLKLDSFATAFVLLGALLVYDVFWVFATPVMVTVAKGIDAPIKILSPKTSPFHSPTEFSMLGLGDIIVPGLVVALCLRFDLYRHAKANPGKNVTPRSNFQWAYWWVGIFSYIVGLGITIGVMHVFKSAQPALLYLSPACIVGPLLFAMARGEVKELWSYSDSSEEDEQKLLDHTIEVASEAAQRARAEVQAIETENETLKEPENVEEETKIIEDDSWMEVEAPEVKEKPKKKKGGKKK